MNIEIPRKNSSDEKLCREDQRYYDLWLLNVLASGIVLLYIERKTDFPEGSQLPTSFLRPFHNRYSKHAGKVSVFRSSIEAVPSLGFHLTEGKMASLCQYLVLLFTPLMLHTASRRRSHHLIFLSLKARGTTLSANNISKVDLNSIFIGQRR